MRKKLAAGNWKMNKTLDEGNTLASSIVNMLSSKLPGNPEIVLIPPFVYLISIKIFLIQLNSVIRFILQKIDIMPIHLF